MPDVIHDPRGVCSLAEQLAATIPPVETRTRITADGWIPEVDHSEWTELRRAERAAEGFLLEAVGWNEELLSEVMLSDAVTGRAYDIVAGAWSHADHAQRDPRLPIVYRDMEPGSDPDKSPAESLAYFALVGEPVDPHNWRVCDRDAAIEMLPFVAARMQANPGEYLRSAGDVDDARRWLVLLEPSLPDLRRA